MQDISIRNKLILMQVFTGVLVMCIFFTVYIVTDIRSYKQRKANDMISLAQVIGTNSVSTLQFHDSEAARKMLSDLLNVAPQIRYAVIVDDKGRPFARYTRKGSDTLALPAGLENDDFLYAGNHLMVKNTITNEGDTLGRVFLVVELSELKEIVQSKYEVAIISLIVALAFAFIVALFMQRYISRRLLHLVDTMTEVSRTGEYDKSIRDNGKDEISTLIRVFNNLMQQVKENQQRKDEFIGIASHELKTPLTTIKGYMELLSFKEERPANRQFVDKVLNNVNKLERLIKDLLDVSKIQGGQLALNIREFDVDQLVNEAIAAVQVVSPNHRISRVGDFGGQTVSADMQRVEQVLVNLLSNAVKYSPGQDKVIVYSQLTGTELIVRIRDFGMGILPEEQSYIFERFYRSRNNSIHISGFGLGLYICKDIINRHGGKIWIEAEELGSSFYFSLPLNNHKELLNSTV